ncbi:hypothetical protein CC79DRAFT_205233 [Sarocladium strictum]
MLLNRFKATTTYSRIKEIRSSVAQTNFTTPPVFTLSTILALEPIYAFDSSPGPANLNLLKMSSTNNSATRWETFIMSKPNIWNHYFYLISAPAMVRVGEEFEIILGTMGESDISIVLAALSMPAEKKIASAFQESIVENNNGVFAFTGFRLILDYPNGGAIVDDLTIRIRIMTDF